MNFFTIIISIISFLLIKPIKAVENGVCLFEGCNCVYSGDNGYDIFCIYDSTKSSNEDFPKRIDLVNITNVNTLLIKRYKFKTLPDDIFKDLNIKNLIIGENDMEMITANAFRGVSSLNLVRIIEKKLDIIESNAMQWLSDKLVELGLWQINFKSDKIDEYFNELKCLKSLKTLKLMGYGIKKFRADWLDLFLNVTSLSLASNDLSSLQVDLFESSKNLISLDLSNNVLDDLNDTFSTLSPIQDSLKDLKLNGNSIKQFVDFPAFINLEILDLSNNKISSLSEKAFSRLLKLSHLYLSDNSINTIDSNTFFHNENLLVILINNNHLSKLPNITHLYKLQILDASNQNKNLDSLDDYSFERAKIPANPLNLNIDSNDIVKFSNKAFCSRNYKLSEITQIGLSYNTMKNVSKCIFKQINSLVSSRIILRVGQSNDLSYRDVCNCDYKVYLGKFNIEMTGVCEMIQFEKCENSTSVNLQYENCTNSTSYDCNAIY